MSVSTAGRIRSKLPYGGKTYRTTPTPRATIKFFAADPRKCKGVLLQKKTVFPDDATVVLTKKAPGKVVVIDNTPWQNDLDNVGIGWVHASDVGEVDIVHFDEEIVWEPAVDADPWVKGDGAGFSSVQGTDILYTDVAAVYERLGPDLIAGPVATLTRAGDRHEFVFIGTKRGNAKLVHLKRKY